MFEFSIEPKRNPSFIARLCLLYEQRVALIASIKRWETNYVTAKNGGAIVLGKEECPCCVKWHSSQCNDCPIRQYSGKRFCRDTPYRNLELTATLCDTFVVCTASEGEVLAEVEFLHSVLEHVNQSIKTVLLEPSTKILKGITQTATAAINKLKTSFRG
jgi:hypothetical protein